MEKNGIAETMTNVWIRKKRSLLPKRRPRRAAACTDFDEKFVRISNESSKLNRGVATKGKKTVRIDGADDEVKYAKLKQDKEYKKSLKRPRKNSSSASASNNVYIKIDEDEIANDYPLPLNYHKSSEETEIDERIFLDAGYEVDTEQLPSRVLHNWALYNSNEMLISLELLPMKLCADVDVTILGSGCVTEDDGTFGVCLDDSDSSQTKDPDGLAIFLSQVKEWKIEFGSSMIIISLRTDVAWYRLGKPSEQYAPWYEPVLKTAKIAISIITLLKDQTRISRLSFQDVVKRLSEFQKNDEAYVSSDI